MSTSRYTEGGDPVVERSVADLVAAIVERARPIAGLESLLLGGSLGRGEGTLATGPDGPTLASDVEVYLVGRGSSLRSAASELQGHFASRSGPEVSAAWLHPEMLRKGHAKNLSMRPSATIRLYELGPGGSRTLIGTPPEVFAIDPATLPLGEGVRLVLNRLAEASVVLATESPDAGRWTDKILMACGDTLLLAAGAYTAQISRSSPSAGRIARAMADATRLEGRGRVGVRTEAVRTGGPKREGSSSSRRTRARHTR